MRLTIIAATGEVGRELLEQAVATGHDVTAVVRDPRKLARPVRTVAAGMVAADPAALEPEVAGADAVLSGLGPHSNADAGMAPQGTRAIVAAMQAAGVRRIVAVSAAPVSTVPTPRNPSPPKHDPGDGFFMRHLLSHLASARLGKVFADLAQMEDSLAGSRLDWTVIRPPQLTGKPSPAPTAPPTARTCGAACPSPAPTPPTSCSASSASPRRSTKPSESPASRSMPPPGIP
jgi:nucleoside-diphosphate-sugar epimerase